MSESRDLPRGVTRDQMGKEGRDRMRSESRERFLREILTRIPAERIGEVHVFPAMRQGGMETGIAVIATTEQDIPVDVSGQAPIPAEVTEEPPQELLGDVLESACENPAREETEGRPTRITVYTARYRQTLKGVDRGTWEFDMVAEADAPLVTVDAVVRGVHKRSGELADAERLTPEAIRAFTDEPWRATTG